jgi:hypothetical protein
MSAAPLDVQIEIVLRDFRARGSERMGAGEVRWIGPDSSRIFRKLAALTWTEARRASTPSVR